MTSTRRGALAAITALAAGAIPAAVATPHPDARLIRLCADYVAAVETCNAHASDLAAEDDPLFWAIEEIEAEVDEQEASTIAGVAAMAAVAQWLAETAFADGSVSWSDTFTGSWPQRVAEAVLRLARQT